MCDQLDLAVADDPTNTDPRFRRNRIRNELLPLLDDIAERDVAMLLTRTADLLRADDRLLDELATAIDPTAADEVVAAPAPLAARALRRWLEHDGYPPDAAGIARVMAVAAGDSAACELAGGIRVEAAVVASSAPPLLHPGSDPRCSSGVSPDRPGERVAWQAVMPSRHRSEAAH